MRLIRSNVILIRIVIEKWKPVLRWCRGEEEEWDWERWSKHFAEVDEQRCIISVLKVFSLLISLYLQLKEKEKWGDKIYAEDEYYFEGYWMDILGTLENITEKYIQIEKESPLLRRRQAEKVSKVYATVWEEYLKGTGYGEEVGEGRSYSLMCHFSPYHASNKWCSEIHVGPVGYPFKSCRESQASARKGNHEWGETVLGDVLIPVDAYHLYDRLGKRIPLKERFLVPRILAVVKLCIQARIDLPEYPTKRRIKPIIRIGKKEFVDEDESELPDPEPVVPKTPILTEIPDSVIIPPSSKEETMLLAG